MANRGAAHFANDLDSLIHRYRHEYDITVGEVVSSLEFAKYILMRNTKYIEEEDDDEE